MEEQLYYILENKTTTKVLATIYVKAKFPTLESVGKAATTIYNEVIKKLGGEIVPHGIYDRKKLERIINLAVLSSFKFSNNIRIKIREIRNEDTRGEIFEMTSIDIVQDTTEFTCTPDKE